MATFVIAHGAWSGGWAWKKIRQRLRARGHEVFTPTYTGLGERAHLARPEFGLETHVQDVLGVLEYEDLSDVVLLGHSYGGVGATPVAHPAPPRVRGTEGLGALQAQPGRALAPQAGRGAGVQGRSALVPHGGAGGGVAARVREPRAGEGRPPLLEPALPPGGGRHVRGRDRPGRRRRRRAMVVRRVRRRLRRRRTARSRGQQEITVRMSLKEQP